MLVGEQPGDQEDLQGKPFVGPAGQLMRTLPADAGIADVDFYLTNAVKHFSWEPRGKRRIHKTPAQRDIAACRNRLGDEIADRRVHRLAKKRRRQRERGCAVRVPIVRHG